jgi:two-component system response regulator RegX3
MVDDEGRVVVLLVEDEVSYVEALEIGLAHEGFQIVAVQSLADARDALARVRFDLILLDVMLPDGSGLDFCRELHANSRVPVIITSAKSSEVDVILGLEFGASDYLTKPYRIRELVARIRAVLRRQAAAPHEDVLTVGDLVIDSQRRSVTRHGAEIELSRKEFDLLALLTSSLGQVVTRDACIDALWWGQDLTDTRTLDTHIKRLRQKIETDSADPRHLITIRGVGFRFDL